MKEKDIVAKIQAYLKATGFFVVKLHGSAMQTAGLPDLMAVRHGRVYWFEAKAPGGKATKLQEHMIGKLRACGCVAEVVTSVDDVKAILAEAA